MPIHCVFVIGDKSGVYYRNTYVTLLSLLENTKSDIVVHIIHDETITHGRESLENLCAEYHCEIKFHHAPAIPAEVFQFAKPEYAPHLYKLRIHELVDADLAIYLDADLIIMCDIAELASVPLEGKIIGAVKNTGGHWDKKDKKVRKKSAALVAGLGLRPESYINSGVMILDLKQIRSLSGNSNPFFDIATHFAGKSLRSTHFDQDIFNAFCVQHGNALLLDPRFNHQAYVAGNAYRSSEELCDKILHYSTPQTRPEAVLFPAQLAYWKYYAMAPWGKDVFEQMGKVFFQHRMRFLRNYAQHPHRRGALRRYAAGGLWGLFTRNEV